MSDLISRQEVIDFMYEVFEKYSVATDKQDELCGFGTEMFRRIKELPIAFDKEKVIAQIQEEKFGKSDETRIALSNAQEYVRKG